MNMPDPRKLNETEHKTSEYRAKTRIYCAAPRSRMSHEGNTE
jgi:hypothetical protein